MASEVVRRVWCDIHLKSKKKKVEGVEGRATALSEGTVITLDCCDECYATLTWKEVITYGAHENVPKPDRTKQSDKTRAATRGGARDLVQCSFPACNGKQVTTGAGWALHHKVHERNGEQANPIPVAS